MKISWLQLNWYLSTRSVSKWETSVDWHSVDRKLCPWLPRTIFYNLMETLSQWGQWRLMMSGFILMPSKCRWRTSHRLFLCYKHSTLQCDVSLNNWQYRWRLCRSSTSKEIPHYWQMQYWLNRLLAAKLRSITRSLLKRTEQLSTSKPL